MNKLPLILALSIGTIGTNSAQSFLNDKSKTETPNFSDIQYQFNDWAAQRELSETKGWKWFKRWEQHYAERANPDGSMPDPNIFYQEAIEYTDIQKQKSNSAWLPMGPNALPPSPNPSSGHGMARINCVTFHPSDANTFWVGVAQGGIWKTTDSGQSWMPLDDGLPILRVSDIAVDPNDPDIMYVCLGDFEYHGVALDLDDRKRHTHYGVGVYKTTDGGLSWNPTGHTLAQTDLDYSLLRKMIINPNNTDELVIGGYEALWKSTDAGASWTNTESDILISDIEQDPMNPNVLYAATCYSFTLQDGSAGILKSTDFGATWAPLNTGIPATGVAGRVNIAIAPTDPNYLYALTCNSEGGFYKMYRSTNAGTSWTEQSDGTTVNILDWFDGTNGQRGQGSYDLCLMVDPHNRDRIYTGGVNIWGSDNGGVSWKAASFWTNSYGQSVHADHHQFKYNPLDDKLYTCNDGGIMRTDSIVFKYWTEIYYGDTWPTVWENLSSGMQVTSFYRLGLDNGRIIAGAQDNSTFYYNGNSWTNIIGGDGMECFFDPTNPNTLFGSYQYGGLVRSDDGGSSFIYYLDDPITVTEEGEWTTPWHYHDQSNTIYTGFGNLWKSTNNGDSWIPLSNFPTMNGATFPAPASALGQCSNDKDVIYMAKRIYHSYNTNSALWVTTNEGLNWTDITAGLPDSLYFTYIAVDDNDPSIAWVTCSGFSAGQKVFKTTDYGQTWTNISTNLPNLPVNCIVLDEQSFEHTVYIATDLGVYYTNDNLNGDWQLFGTGLPNVITSELEIDYANQDLYVATFGRGIWKADLSLVSGTKPSVFEDSGIELLPNPNQGIFNLNITSQEDYQTTMNVVDVMGRVVYTEVLDITRGDQTLSLDLDLNSGVYYLQLVEGKDMKVVKFLVNN